MGRNRGIIWTLVFIAGLCAGSAFAQEKSPLSLKLGLVERIRNEYYNNIQDMSLNNDDRTDYFRIRTSVWAQAAYAPYATAYVKLTNEFRKYVYDPKKRDFTWDELIFDNLYLKLETPNKFAALTVGRQNLTYGEGFILMEGAPWDGSRTIYHDAVKLSLTRGKTTVDLLGIDNRRIDDRLGPILRGADLKNGRLKAQTRDQWMNDGEEKALGLYATTTAVAKSKIEAYFIRKMELPDPWIPKPGVLRDELKLNTVGARLSYGFTPRLSLTTEWALQNGTQGPIKHKAYGGYAYASWVLEPQSKAALSAGVIALSGDDPKTPDNEGWNPLFSRWPKWSELYIYTVMNEVIRNSTRVAYSTNTWSPYLSYTVQLSGRLSMIVNYYHLKAYQARVLPDGSMSGKTRGNEFQCWLKYAFNKNLSGHILYDVLFPGDFYAMPRTSGPFVRGELMISI
jgi:hypothetical protein